MGEVKPIAIILAGGSGTRFWPASSPEMPKQYLSLTPDHQSLIQKTVKRLSPLVGTEEVVICSTQAQLPIIREQLPQIKRHVLEPTARNTAACIALTMLHLIRHETPLATPVAVLPADHLIGDEAGFRKYLARALAIAVETRGLVTFGIRPNSPHTGYGYIEAEKGTGDFFPIKKFVEKPQLADAERYVREGRYFWNSGMFVWTLGAISQAFETLLPEVWRPLAEKPEKEWEQIYRTLPALPVDVGIMEKAKNAFVIPADFGWSDVGSWKALHEVITDGRCENTTLEGATFFHQAEGCLVKVPKKNVAVIGVNNLIIVEEGDSLLILQRSSDQEVRKAASFFEHAKKEG